MRVHVQQQSSVCVGCVHGAASTPCWGSGCANGSFHGDKMREIDTKASALAKCLPISQKAEEQSKIWQYFTYKTTDNKMSV